MNSLIEDCEYDLTHEKTKMNECDSDDYSIVDVECESVIDTSNNSDDENNEILSSGIDVNKSDDEEFIEIKDNADKCPDDETVLLSNEGISFAPGENNIPRSILYDSHAESCTFIKIYAGTLRQMPKHLTHQKVLQSEILRSDRRCSDPYRLFHAAGMLRIEKMSQRLFICLRRSRNNPLLHLPTTFSRVLTASQLLNESFVNNLTLKDCAYKIFEHDRGSPAYLAYRKRDLFAMIRQLGPAHIFLTLSSAETK